jgi:hypothetical protein
MKTIKNIISTLWVALALVGLTACGDDDAKYTPAEQEPGAQAYFPSTNSSSVSLSTANTSFNVIVNRVVTDEATTVPVSVTGNDEGYYTVPSSVSFAQGESSANLTIGYDPDVLGYDNFSNLTFTLDSGYTTEYGMSTYTVKVGIPAPWKSLGQCTYVDDFITSFWGVENIAYNVEIQENMLQPGYFRLVNAYGAAYPYNGDGDYDDSQDYYLEIHAEDPDAVYMNVQNVGMDWGYGEISVGSLAGYYIDREGKTLEEMKAAGYTGTYKDGIITFPTSSLVVGMTDYNNGSMRYANNNGAFKVVMPGVVLANYYVEVAYGGKYTNAAGEDAGVIAQLDSVGTDVDFVRLALVPGTDTNYAYEAARSENVNVVDVDPTTTKVMVPFTETPEDGKYTLVAISYSGKVAQESSYATFKYVSSSNAETWTAQYMGNYTYTHFFGSEDEPAVDEDLVLYQSDKDPNRWKIEHWGYDVDFIFTFNQATGEILVEDQEIGYVHPSYGMVMVDDMVDYFGSQDKGYSYYKDNVFHFNVIYYIPDAGYFGYGEETFELTAYATRSVNAAHARAHSLKANTNAKLNVKLMRHTDVKPAIR